MIIMMELLKMVQIRNVTKFLKRLPIVNPELITKDLSLAIDVNQE